MQSFYDFNSDQRSHAKVKLFNCGKYCYLLLWYSSKSEKRMLRESVEMDVVGCQVLKQSGENVVLRLSWS